MQREQLPFRPLDNSTSTRMGYDIEVAQWITSIKSAQSSTSSGMSSLGLIGFFFSVAINLILIFIMLVLMLIEWILKPNEEERKPISDHKPKYFKSTNDDLKNVWD